MRGYARRVNVSGSLKADLYASLSYLGWPNIKIFISNIEIFSLKSQSWASLNVSFDGPLRIEMSVSCSSNGEAYAVYAQPSICSSNNVELKINKLYSSQLSTACAPNEASISSDEASGHTVLKQVALRKTFTIIMPVRGGWRLCA